MGAAEDTGAGATDMPLDSLTSSASHSYYYPLYVLKVNHAMIMCFKEKQRCCKNSFYLVEEWFYSANIDGIVDDSLLEANRAIVIYFRNREWTHEF